MFSYIRNLFCLFLVNSLSVSLDDLKNRIPSFYICFKGCFLNVPNGTFTVSLFLAKKLRCTNMTPVNVIERILQQQKC